jgi:uncharacterized protein
MTLPAGVALSYALLALAILGLWIGAGRPTATQRQLAWSILFGLSLAVALATGVVQPLGLAWIAAFAAATFGFGQVSGAPVLRIVCALAILALAAGLMLHRLPGFHNLRVISAMRFTADAVPFTLYLNYDKTLIGLFIVGWCHERIARSGEWRVMLAQMLPIAAGLIVAMLGLSLALGYVRFAPKFPAESWVWLGVNLLFVCVAEEAFFRGFVQAQLQRLWSRVPRGEWLALLVAAMLFGAAHAAGGAMYVLLATLAGVGYGWVYRRTGRIEASILTHFALNAVHFFGFTYPALA